MHYQAIKYFSRLSSINNERLLHEAYNLEKQKLQTGEKGFIKYITDVLNKIGMSNVWIGQIEHDRNNLLEKPLINKAILTRFNDVFSQTAMAQKLLNGRSSHDKIWHKCSLTIWQFK